MKLKILSLILKCVLILSLMTTLSFQTVYAVEDDDPRIAFDANGGSGYMATVYYQGNYPLPECEFTAPEGYRFKCWHRDGDPRELQPGDTVYVDSSNDVVSAVWELIPAKVIFDNGGGEGIMDEVEIYGDYTLPSCSFTAPDGQQFKSWLINEQEKQPGDPVYVDGIITATALWETIPTEAPTDTPIPPSDNNDTNQLQNTQPGNPGDNTQNDWALVIAIVLGVVLICAVCVTGGILIVLLVKKGK